MVILVILVISIIIALIIHTFFFRKIKRDIISLKSQLANIKPSSIETNLKPDATINLSSTDIISKLQSKLPIENLENKSQEVILANKKYLKKTILLLKKFEHIFIERWIALIAVVILVVGISFFGIWASTKILPILRFWIIVGSAIILGALSIFAARYQKFYYLAVWLRSAGAAIYLFAALGSGRIPGIEWIESPVMSLLMLTTGILVNLVLAFIGKKQFFSSFHIILSIIAVSIASQTVVTLIVATIVTFSGITISFRKKWDIQHLVSIIFYFGFIIFWGFSVDPTDNFPAVSAVLLTAIPTLFIHYRRIYANSEFELTPLIVHLVNWLFLSVGLIRFSPITDYIFFPLFISGVLLFFLARKAKKMGINWLYSTDTLISQLMILLSLISLFEFDFSNFLIIFLVLIESLGFSIIIWKEKEYFVYIMGFSISTLAAIAMLFTGLESVSYYNELEQTLTLCGLFILSATFMTTWLLFIYKDNTNIVFIGDKIKRTVLAGLYKANINIQGILIPFFILAIYLLIMSIDIISDYIGPDTFTATLFIALLYTKFQIKNLGMKIGIIFYLVITSVFSIGSLGNKEFSTDSSVIPVIVYYLPTLLMSVSLLIYSLKKRKGIHKKIPGIYLLTIHLLFLSFFILEDVSGLITGISWLILAILYLLIANTLKHGKMEEYMVQKLNRGLINGGYLFLLSFIVRFLFFDIHENTFLLTNIRAETLLEIAAVAVMGIWFLFNKKKSLLDLLFLEITLVFLTIVLFFEVPVTILPFVFIILSITLLLIGLLLKKSLSRLRIISIFPTWISAFLIAFVTSPHLLPSLSYTDTAWIMSALGILFQFVYLAIFHFSHKFDKITLPTKLLRMEHIINKFISEKNIFLYYPVFASVLFFLIWSFKGAVLTALISFEALLILVLSILVKERSFRYIALAGIIISIIRLIFFDLREADIFIKAIAFIIVSIIMLLMNILYTKFKNRIEEYCD